MTITLTSQFRQAVNKYKQGLLTDNQALEVSNFNWLADNWHRTNEVDPLTRLELSEFQRFLLSQGYKRQIGQTSSQLVKPSDKASK